MDIRPAVRADTPALLGLIEAYWTLEGLEGFDARRITPLFARLFEEPRLGGIWVAEAAQRGAAKSAAPSRLVGYLIAVTVLSIEHGGMMAEIDEFFVTAAARAQGTGTRLLAAAEEALAQAGCVRLQLQLGVGNASARQFYERRGYRRRVGFELWDKSLASGSK